jgi:hypothetical protein
MFGDKLKKGVTKLVLGLTLIASSSGATVLSPSTVFAQENNPQVTQEQQAAANSLEAEQKKLVAQVEADAKNVQAAIVKLDTQYDDVKTLSADEREQLRDFVFSINEQADFIKYHDKKAKLVSKIMNSSRTPQQKIKLMEKIKTITTNHLKTLKNIDAQIDQAIKTQENQKIIRYLKTVKKAIVWSMSMENDLMALYSIQISTLELEALGPIPSKK